MVQASFQEHRIKNHDIRYCTGRLDTYHKEVEVRIKRAAEIDFVSVGRWSQNFQEESHTDFFIHLIEYQTKPWGPTPL